MVNPNPLSRSADEIIANILTDEFDHSSWHFFQARSWLDLAKRTDNPSAIQYAALELRYGLEYLLFELLVLKNHFLDEKEYRRCIGHRNEIEKMLKHVGPSYPKLCRFTELVIRTGATPSYPIIQFWDLGDIAKYWGIASEYLHFVGPHIRTHRNHDWCGAAIARLSEISDKIWQAVTRTAATALLNPANMEPEVRQAWAEFQSGSLSEDELVNRMRILTPILNARLTARNAGLISPI
jgi:hypothetical protein